MENTKVTYILGAGASALGLPTVRRYNGTSEYTDSLRDIARRLEADFSINESYVDLKDDLCKSLNWLATKGDEYGTIDTYAKFCFDTKQPELQRVKETLSTYFTIKQHIDKKTDPRYRNFVIKNLDKGTFPNNIKILNWNYDFQMQLACEIYKKEEFHYSYNVTQHAPPLIPYYPAIGNEFNINHSSSGRDLSMIHLNGIAGFYFYQQNAHILNYHLNQSLDNINQLFEKLKNDKEHKHQLLTFAYEGSDGANYYLRNRLKFATEIIQGTEILVIIGYSFPDDNVKVDNHILNALKESGLKKIVFQNPSDDGSFLIDEFGLNGIRLIHKLNCDEFFIPRELKIMKNDNN